MRGLRVSASYGAAHGMPVSRDVGKGRWVGVRTRNRFSNPFVVCFGGVFAQRAHSAGRIITVIIQVTTLKTIPPRGIMHNQFQTQKFKHLMLAMGPRDLNSAPYSPVHCSSHSMTSFQSSELTEIPVVENSQLFAQRAHGARYAPFAPSHFVPNGFPVKMEIFLHFAPHDGNFSSGLEGASCTVRAVRTRVRLRPGWSRMLVPNGCCPLPCPPPQEGALCTVRALCPRCAKSRVFSDPFPPMAKLTAVGTVFPYTGLLGFLLKPKTRITNSVSH